MGRREASETQIELKGGVTEQYMVYIHLEVMTLLITVMSTLAYLTKIGLIKQCHAELQ